MTGMIGWLLLGMVLLPTLGAITARLIARHTGSVLPRLMGALGFGGAMLCAIILSRTPVDAASLGRLAIFLPSNDVMIARESLLAPPDRSPAAAMPPTATQAAVIAAVEPTATTQPTPTNAPTATIVPTATVAPTTTPAIEPTAEPTPEPTAEPTATAPPPTDVPAAAPQRYVVEAGDTLRGIAERFNISVEQLLNYNGLTPEEGDSLRIDQVLYIPPR